MKALWFNYVTILVQTKRQHFSINCCINMVSDHIFILLLIFYICEAVFVICGSNDVYLFYKKLNFLDLVFKSKCSRSYKHKINSKIVLFLRWVKAIWMWRSINILISNIWINVVGIHHPSDLKSPKNFRSFVKFHLYNYVIELWKIESYLYF